MIKGRYSQLIPLMLALNIDLELNNLNSIQCSVQPDNLSKNSAAEMGSREKHEVAKSCPSPKRQKEKHVEKGNSNKHRE